MLGLTVVALPVNTLVNSAFDNENSSFGLAGARFLVMVGNLVLNGAGSTAVVRVAEAAFFSSIIRCV
jgi:hypothetical protein